MKNKEGRRSGINARMCVKQSAIRYKILQTKFVLLFIDFEIFTVSQYGLRKTNLKSWSGLIGSGLDSNVMA